MASGIGSFTEMFDQLAVEDDSQLSKDTWAALVPQAPSHGGWLTSTSLPTIQGKTRGGPEHGSESLLILKQAGCRIDAQNIYLSYQSSAAFIGGDNRPRVSSYYSPQSVHKVGELSRDPTSPN
ncbi:hypothetical protein PM082_015140 [Marasmius tenuissimus]|nr:hypothetical protein PM082_015140 [Marasmius tenuissimus]